MVRNKLAAAVLMISALQAGLASALGLGEINLKSALNQPLDAEIRLLDTGDLDSSQVMVRLASSADFERIGVSRDFFLTNLRFDVQLDGRGSGVVRVTTRDAVIEPYLNFLVEARWPNGRLLREYTVLMDMPTFSDGAAVRPTVTATGRSTAAPEPAHGSAATADQVPAARSGAARTQMPEASDASQYRVQHNDTMYEIAARFRSGEASVQQIMLAIQQLNPQAFINGNINLVKSGYVLRLPDPHQARDISQQQALEELARQNRAWRTGTTGDGGAAPQLDARDTGGAGGDGGAQGDARLSIAASGDSDRAAAGEGTGSGAAGISALRDQLAASQENLDKTQRHNEELESRLSDMERQIATLQRLIELKDDQLAALQARDTAGESSADEPTADRAAGDADAPVDFNYAGSEADRATEAEIAAAPAPAAAPRPAAKPGLMERLTSNWLYVGGLIAALVLALVAVLVARRRRAEADEALSEAVFRPAAPTEPAAVGETEPLVPADDEPQSAELEQPDAEQPAVEAPLASAADTDDEPDGAATMAIAANTAAAAAATSQPVQAETGDALAEADIYIAYGRYQQAADLLLSAIRSEPERTDLRVKLLEVYVESRDKNAFQEHFLELSAMGDDDAVAQVKELMSSVDGVSEWLDDLPAASFAAVAAAAGDEPKPETDLELGASLDDSDEPLFADAETDAEELESFDFDLKLDTLDGSSSLDLEETGLDDLNSAAAAAAGIGLVDPELHSETDSDAGLELELETLGDAAVDYRPLDTESEDGAEFDLEDTATPGITAPDAISDNDLDELELSLEGELGAGTDGSILQPGGLDGLGDGLELDDASLDSLDDDDAFDLALAETADLSDLDIDFEPQQDLTATGDGTENLLDPESKPEPALEESEAGREADLDIDGEPSDAAPAFLDTAGDVLTEDTLASETMSGDAPFEDPLNVVFDADDISDEPEDGESDEGFDFLGDTDEVATRLDLARAYIDMGDTDGARDILDDVVQDGDEAQRQEAEELLARL